MSKLLWRGAFDVRTDEEDVARFGNALDAQGAMVPPIYPTRWLGAPAVKKALADAVSIHATTWAGLVQTSQHIGYNRCLQVAGDYTFEVELWSGDRAGGFVVRATFSDALGEVGRLRSDVLLIAAGVEH